MIGDFFDELNRIIDESSKPKPKPKKPVKSLCDLAGAAASSVKVSWHGELEYFPGDRLPAEFLSPSCKDSVQIDATDFVEFDIDELGYGSAFVEDNERSAMVEVSEPVMFIVDASGKTIEGARIMVRFNNVTVSHD